MKTSNACLGVKFILPPHDSCRVIGRQRKAARWYNNARHPVLINGPPSAVGLWPLKVNAADAWFADDGRWLDGFRNIRKRCYFAQHSAPIAPPTAVFGANTDVEHPRRARQPRQTVTLRHRRNNFGVAGAKHVELVLHLRGKHWQTGVPGGRDAAVGSGGKHRFVSLETVTFGRGGAPRSCSRRRHCSTWAAANAVAHWWVIANQPAAAGGGQEEQGAFQRRMVPGQNVTKRRRGKDVTYGGERPPFNWQTIVLILFRKEPS
jgi:hypothetical protein